MPNGYQTKLCYNEYPVLLGATVQSLHLIISNKFLHSWRKWIEISLKIFSLIGIEIAIQNLKITSKLFL